ncbi:U1 small nuclear ribonucleoprotein 70 kDa [Cornus florida]|uniref:U1 small nuclear ribonucleoprotein 70 kDa n=1 Tax=Cornus florida TaxID=4283 RepID=UPI0028A0BCBA|nr:U1 small nuclear ribonucleoprotein 70 kDa [Cornus florida]
MGDNNDASTRSDKARAVKIAAAKIEAAKIEELKQIAKSHPTGMTPNILKLFEPRPPLEYKPLPEKKKCPLYTGMAQFVSNFAEPGDPEYAPPVQKAETPAQVRAGIHKLRLEEGSKKAAEELEKYDPNSDPNISGDPYKTLFVSRLNYETTESRIKREFEAYGPIKRIQLITDKVTNKPRGYGFIEYMHTRDMKDAYKQADGTKLDDKRVLVDVERGRTVPNWRPRRLGGGLGTTRVGSEEVNQKYSVREQQQSGAPPRSEEPRARGDRHEVRHMEKSRDGGRDRGREQERFHERSHDRPRDRDHRDDRHHRDWDRNRDRNKGRDHGRDRDQAQDRDRARDRGRDYDRGQNRDRDRDRHRHREEERDRDYEVRDPSRGRSRDGYDYDQVESKQHHRRSYEHAEPEKDPGWYDEPEHGQRHADAEHHHRHYHRDRGQHDNLDVQGDEV